jgi:hypothetical protein
LTFKRIETMKPHMLAPLVLLLTATSAFADTAVYDLNSSNAKEIAEAIGRVLSAQCASGPKDTVSNTSRCRAELLPTGQLLVEAPPDSQSQIGAVLKAIAAKNASPTSRVTLQYWVIWGEPGKPDAAGPALKPLDAVLKQLERAHGELGFSLQDTTSITAQSGTSAATRGGAFQINQTVRATGDGVDLSAQLSFARAPVVQNLNVRVTIKRGEFVVLGERTTTGEPGRNEPDRPERSGMLFFVVHWPQDQ